MIWNRKHKREVEQIEAESQERLEKLATAENHLYRIVWLCRASFELGYRKGNPNTKPNEWREDWRKSQARAELVAMGYIKEEDTYR